ncbi:MAG TPA: J domain-containing protein [Methylomirabilota bacterium]|nr:J domain-containing protein [Methylomirabilota bacterium]
MNKERFPLSWPDGKPRTPEHRRERSRFRRPGYAWVGHSMSEAVDLITAEVRLLGGASSIVSSNVRLRVDGLPYSGQAQPKDQGAAIYFMLKGRPVVFACDKYNRVECNLFAIGKTIEATRAVERWGAASIEQSFRGFMALPEKASGPDPYELLGLKHGCTEDDLKAAYREAAKTFHPDVPVTGSYAKWQQIQDAHNLIAQNVTAALKGGQ